jgi:fucose 4-O-acetylase-like acetyltransferase
MLIKLPAFTSQKFKFWSFISMALLVFVHGYNLNDRYMQPWTIPGEPLTFTSYTEYFLANGIFRFRIPMLFIISGYLFALGDIQPHKKRVGKRLRTLLVPYLAWSAIGIAFTFALEMFPYSRNIIAGTHILQIDEKRMLIHDYHWYEVLARWIFFPVSYQLWFLRVLLVYNIVYPLIQWCVMHKIVRWIFFGVAILLWLSTAGFVLIEGEGLLFFSLGVWLQKTSFDINTPKRWLQPLWWGIIFILLCAVKTWLAFRGIEVIGTLVFPVLTLMHKLAILSGLITAWYGCDTLVRFCMKQKWFVWIAAFSFMIYAFHVPLVAYAIDAVFAFINNIPGYRMFTFIFLPLTVIILCIAIGAVLRKATPKLYSILTGGRGF